MSGSGRQWHCMVGGQQYGPVSEAELLEWVRQGRIRPEDSVWTADLGSWRPLRDVQYMFRAGVVMAPAVATTLQPHRATLILVLGIVGLALGLLGIPGGIAWYLANQDLRQMDAGLMDPSGRGMTVAGKVCGIISVAMAIIGCCIGSIWLAFFFSMAGPGMRF